MGMGEWGEEEEEVEEEEEEQEEEEAAARIQPALTFHDPPRPAPRIGGRPLGRRCPEYHSAADRGAPKDTATVAWGGRMYGRLAPPRRGGDAGADIQG